MLETGLGQPDVAAASKAESANPFRDRPLDPRTPGVLRLPGRGLLLNSGRLQRLVPLLRSQRHLAALRPGPRTQGATAAGQALTPRELGVHHLVTPPIAPRLPQHAGL